MTRRSTLTLVVVLLAGSVAAADDLKSGPPVGARNDRNGFVPRFVAGPSAGLKLCPV
jgi:hypothetical protein